MAFQDPYLDAPAHPLGIVFDPNWQAVRDRKAILECNQIQREFAQKQRAERPPFICTRLGEAIVGFTLMGAMVGGAWLLAIHAVWK